MSQDFSVMCDRCKTYRHLGQDMGGQLSFGFGSVDAEGRYIAMSFIVKHLYYNADGDRCEALSVRVVLSDSVPDDYVCDEQSDGEARRAAEHAKYVESRS